MVQFLKENSYTIVKMLINQLGMTMFGFLLAMATSSNETFLLLTSIFSICFYLFLLYSMSWEAGAKDKIRVDSSRAKYVPAKGLYMSIVANIPNLVLGILIIIGYIFGKTYEWAANLLVVTNMIARMVEAMYLGVIQIFSPFNPIAFILIQLPAFVVCGIAYYLGVKNLRIGSIFGIKYTPDKKSK